MVQINLWGLLALCIGATYFWRAAGVFIASKLDPGSDLFKWLACVAYGMLAGLISRIFIFPVGLLAETPLIDRLVALGLGYILFFMMGRNLFAGTSVAVLVFLALTTTRSYGLI